jgi:hypothetical protein
VASRGNLFTRTRQPSCAATWCEQLDFNPRSSPELGITQQLETPVIYFYSPSGIDAQVDVSFPNGIITEVFPKMSHFTPALNQVQSVSNGTGRWNVHIHKTGATVPVPPVTANSIWAPSRRVSANMVTNVATKENEHHIFYRGVGHFDSELTVTSNADHITVANGQEEDVPAVFVLASNGTHGTIKSLGGIHAGQAVTLPIFGSRCPFSQCPADLPMDLFITRAQVLVEKALIEGGLYPLEARAMVETWSHSYFGLKGTRVLYVAPRVWADRLLPLRIQPTPKDTQRVFIGRIEVMLASEEKALMEAVRSIMGTPAVQADVVKTLAAAGIPQLGRFAEAKLRRAFAVAMPFGCCPPRCGDGCCGGCDSASLERYIADHLTF